MSTVLSRHLAMIGSYVNTALASGRRDDIDVSLVLRHANKGQLFSSLETVLGQDADFGWLSEDQRAELNDEWSRIANCFVVEDFGLTYGSRGLFLVMALILEGIKMRETPTNIQKPL
jgi:hypothetical protein